MTNGWTRTQEEGWLCRLLGENAEKSPKESTVWQLYRMIEEVMSYKTSAKDSATKTASLISRKPKAWFDIVGIDVALAVKLEDEDALEALVDYIVALASLPDAVNESHEPVVVDNIGYGGTSVLIEPGEPLVMGSGAAKLWRDLPGWSMEITEGFQGKDLYYICYYSLFKRHYRT